MELNQQVLVWIILGLVLIASEMFTGTFHLLFFGLASFLTAGFVYAGVGPLWQQATIFGILSLVSFFLVQKKFKKQLKGPGFETDLNQTLTLSDSLPASGEGTVQYQGAPWTAVNMETTPLAKGQRAIIVKTEGVKIFLRSHK